MINIILLAAGNSTRFNSDIPKQIYPISDKNLNVLEWQIEKFKSFLGKDLDKIYIVINEKCKKFLKDKYLGENIILCENNINCRLSSIHAGLSKIQKSDKILIHDAARPFFKKEDILFLSFFSKESDYVQYFFPLKNGLLHKTLNGYEVVNREDYIELTTPLISNFELYKDIFYEYLYTCKRYEIIPYLNENQFKLIEGNSHSLRKITNLNDIESF